MGILVQLLHLETSRLSVIYIEAQAKARHSEYEAEIVAKKAYRDVVATEDARHERAKGFTAWQDMENETRHAVSLRDTLKHAGDVWLEKLHACLVGWRDHSDLLDPEFRDDRVKRLDEMHKLSMEMVFHQLDVFDLQIEFEKARAKYHRTVDMFIECTRRLDLVFPLYNTGSDELCTFCRDTLHGTTQPVIALKCGHQLHDACFGVYMHMKADEHVKRHFACWHKLIFECLTCKERLLIIIPREA